ncbi:ABC transporter ATP-binding protein [Propionicicella superfundia]|uniref:ABC transporter ATP-binding protein n=1 Tax=Propionicicella superfundia TaxID=348582 RepID=UPI0004069676|nr:ATP-binding cassette domain-containing protein [Propionicicella superfundia]
MTEPNAVISVRDLHMSFGEQHVLKGLSFEVYRGETFGLLGSNGSGKTTTLRALLGIYPTARGEALIEGTRFDPSMGARIGYLPEERGLYRKEPVLPVMTYFGQLKGMPAAVAEGWSRGYLEKVGLAGKERTRLDKLSGGEQQKVQLGVTIMNDPALLILDEPTKGFDPVNRRLLMSIVEEHRQRGATIVMITHQMEEVERLCDRVLLLKDGVAEAYGTVPQVQDQYGGRTLRIEFTGRLPDSPTVRPTVREQNYAEIPLPDGAPATGILRELLDAGVEIRRFETSRASLEQIFLQVYGERAED